MASRPVGLFLVVAFIELEHCLGWPKSAKLFFEHVEAMQQKMTYVSLQCFQACCFTDSYLCVYKQLVKNRKQAAGVTASISDCLQHSRGRLLTGLTTVNLTSPCKWSLSLVPRNMAHSRVPHVPPVFLKDL